jgi:hypothetical protein
LIKIEDPELERLLADASAASGVEPGALLASLLRERVSMANDKENQGSVNPKSENNQNFVNNSPFPSIGKSQGELYEKNTNTPNPPAPENENPNKKIVNVPLTLTINSGDLSRVTDPQSGSEIWGTRLPKTWSEAAKKICEEKKWTKSELTRNALCVFIQAYMSSGIDLSEVEVKPRNNVVLNYNSIENNVNVGRPPYKKYEREIEEPRLKARFRKLAEEVLKGPPKNKKYMPWENEQVEVDPTPEEVAKWLGSKSDELSSIVKRIDQLKLQLSPKEEELLKEVRKKLASMGGGQG